MITRTGRLSFVAAAVVLVAHSLVSAAGRRSSALTPTISGVVIADATSSPLGGVIVTLSGSHLDRPRGTITTIDGTFTFDSIPSGEYSVAASKPPYLRTSYGSSRPAGAGTSVVLAEGEHLNNLVIRLRSGGVVTGVLRDSTGAVISGASVWAVRVKGSLAQPTATQTSTDDLGVYRIFGLIPGAYLIAGNYNAVGVGPLSVPSVQEIDDRLAALSSRRPRPAPRAPSNVSFRPARVYGSSPTFYPGTANPRDAISVAVNAGEETTADLTLLQEPACTVEGRVQMSDGSPLPKGLSLELDQDSPELPSSLSSRPLLTVAPSGTSNVFRFSNVVPGKYLLTASATEPSEHRPEWAGLDVSIAGADIAGLELPLARGSQVTGSVQFENGAGPASLHAQVILSPSDRSLGPRSTNLRARVPKPAPVTSSSRFAVSDVFPGSYLVSIATADGWWLKSAKLGDRDVADLPLFVRGQEDISGLVLTLSRDPARVLGNVVTSNGAPATAYTIVLIPRDPALWRPGSRRIQSANPSNKGSFAFTTVPSGEYLLAAVADLEPSDLEDSTFLASLSRSAIAITAVEGRTISQELRLTGK